MKRPATSTSRILRAALLILLLAAQGFAVAHEFEHWGQPTQELCATCSLSSGLDAPVASNPPALESTLKPAVYFQYCAKSIAQRTARHYDQRAPPFYL